MQVSGPFVASLYSYVLMYLHCLISVSRPKYAFLVREVAAPGTTVLIALPNKVKEGGKRLPKLGHNPPG